MLRQLKICLRLRFILCLTLHMVVCLATQNSLADPAQDRQAFRYTYQQRFPMVEIDDFVLGVYAIDENLRAQYEAINEFPPYEFALDEGATLARAVFANGTTLTTCLAANANRGINEYPFFDVASGAVITLPVAINQCRESNGAAHLNYTQQPLAKLMAYLNFHARGSRRAVELPRGGRALAAYEAGREYFYSKRGRLNLSCADILDFASANE